MLIRQKWAILGNELQFFIAQYGPIWHNHAMLSYSLNSKLEKDLKYLDNKICLKAEDIKIISEAEMDQIHRFVRVSQVGASTRIENAVLTDSEVSWIDTLLTESARPTAFREEEHRIENKLSKEQVRKVHG